MQTNAACHHVRAFGYRGMEIILAKLLEAVIVYRSERLQPTSLADKKPGSHLSNSYLHIPNVCRDNERMNTPVFEANDRATFHQSEEA